MGAGMRPSAPLEVIARALVFSVMSAGTIVWLAVLVVIGVITAGCVGWLNVLSRVLVGRAGKRNVDAEDDRPPFMQPGPGQDPRGGIYPVAQDEDREPTDDHNEWVTATINGYSRR